MAWSFPRLTRRDFFKTTGAGVAGLGLLSSFAALTQRSVAEESFAEETSYNICNFCSSLCNLAVTTHTRQGERRIVKVEGNPQSTLNRGKICARGQAGLRQVYDPDRLKTPLIRIPGSPRGEARFRQATWDEAYAYIDERIKQAEIKPWEWTIMNGWSSWAFYKNWILPFAMANEVPNLMVSTMQHCIASGHLGTDTVTGNFNVHDEVLPDFENARYILFVANNASIGGVSTSRMVRFAQSRKKGAKVVALDPRCSETAAKADEWIAIRPGTDLDFLLALLKIMLDEGLYDSLFLQRHTNMPFLVFKDDAGEWQPLADKDGRPKVLQENSSQLRILDQYTHSNAKDAYSKNIFPALRAPEGFSVDGRTVVTVFQAQLHELAICTPEWASVSTGIDADTIRRIAREFGTTRPAIVDPGWHGARYGNVMMLRRVQAMIQALNGGIDKEGGWMMSGEYHRKAAQMIETRCLIAASPDNQDMEVPIAHLAGLPFARMLIDSLSKGAGFSHGYPGWAWAFSAQEKAAGRPNVALPLMADTGFSEAIKGLVRWDDKPYFARAVLINAANPVRHYHPDTHWKEALSHENMALVIAIDVLPSDTIPYADVILPNSSYLERNEPTLYANGANHDLALTTRYAAIDPLYDTEETADILLRLTAIISGNTEGFLDWIEKLTDLPSQPIQAAMEARRKTQSKGTFSAACRDISFLETAKRLNTTPTEIDRRLRAKGVYQEETREQLLKKYAMPRQLPLPTDSGRIEFFSPFFHELRQAGYLEPNFSVLATPIPAACRKDKAMHTPLDKDEFYFAYGKTPTISHAATNGNNPVLAAINHFKGDIYTGIWIHPRRAEALSISSGDRLRLTNTLSGQQAEGRAYVTRLIHPDTLFLHASFGIENPALSRSHGRGTAINRLIPYLIDPVVAGFRSQEFTIRVHKLTPEGGAA